ncbi:MAG: DUF2304 domain-containing protein [Candidatus Tectomicrobia bacterium]|nr:DUF2304 domain-containing protein [Candidatus Tectomicrobia bacterium]
METRLQIFAITGSLFLLAIILEFIRRRRLKEEYALLWLATGVISLIFSLHRDLVDLLGNLIGIYYSPTALFLLGMLSVTLILLHFSIVVSALSDRNTCLTQQVALLSWQVEALKREQSAIAAQSSQSAASHAEEQPTEGCWAARNFDND